MSLCLGHSMGKPPQKQGAREETPSGMGFLEVEGASIGLRSTAVPPILNTILRKPRLV